MVKTSLPRALRFGPPGVDVEDMANLARLDDSATSHHWSEVSAAGRRTELMVMGVGDPVVFFHGWGLSPRSYLAALRAASAHHRRILAPSLPGFGGSAPLPWRRQHLSGVADHMASVLDAFGYTGGVDVVGHSFGGGVALELAAARPDLVRSLVLVCPVGGAGHGAVPLTRMAAGAVMEARPASVPRVVSDFGRALTRHPSSVVTAAWAAWRADLVPRLTQVNQHGVPVRLIFADSDRVVTPGDMATCEDSNVTVEVVAGRHGWLINEPERFAALVMRGLAAVDDQVAVA
jgi:pimeloyl-ACP methyl ester carboxylesterase